jgi:hypothetical protein
MKTDFDVWWQRQGSRIPVAKTACEIAWANGDYIARVSASDAVCDWTENEADGFWEGECGLAWEFTTGTPETNGFLCCPQCGRRVNTKGPT